MLSSSFHERAFPVRLNACDNKSMDAIRERVSKSIAERRSLKGPSLDRCHFVIPSFSLLPPNLQLISSFPLFLVVIIHIATLQDHLDEFRGPELEVFVRELDGGARDLALSLFRDLAAFSLDDRLIALQYVNNGYSFTPFSILMT